MGDQYDCQSGSVLSEFTLPGYAENLCLLENFEKILIHTNLEAPLPNLSKLMSCKRSFFQTAVVSILLYGCTTWTLTKGMKKKLDGNYTKMLRAILNKSWRQHPTRYQLYGHKVPTIRPPAVSRKIYKLDEPDAQDTAGEARTNSSVMYSYGPPHMAKQKQDDQLEHAYSSYVRIRDVSLKTCQRR